MSTPTIITALDRVLVLIQAGTVALESARRVSETIKRARLQNRDLTPEELDSLATADDAAANALDEAIRHARQP